VAGLASHFGRSLVNRERLALRTAGDHRHIAVCDGEDGGAGPRVGQGVRLICCYLPVKSPWLNAIEPKRVHGKRRVIEADGLLTIDELTDRVLLALSHRV